MSDLIAIVPSRGRPAAVAELAEAWEATCAADSRLLFTVDSGDPTIPAYAEAVKAAQTGSAFTIGMLPNNGEQTMIAALNAAAVTYASGTRRPKALMFLGDDHRPRTSGWDGSYLRALREMGGGIVYGDDQIQGQKLPTQVAISAQIVATLGYMAPPDLVHMYADNAWLALGRAIGRIRYLPDVVIEHLHPIAGTAEWDDGYRRVNHPHMYDRDRAAFARWVRESLPVDAARVRAALEAAP